jgi:hypothetical protein
MNSGNSHHGNALPCNTVSQNTMGQRAMHEGGFRKNVLRNLLLKAGEIVSSLATDIKGRSRTLHGQAHGRLDHRSEGEPSLADLSSRRDHPLDLGSRGAIHLAGVRGLSPTCRGVLRTPGPKIENPAKKAYLLWPAYILQKSRFALAMLITLVQVSVRSRTCS